MVNGFSDRKKLLALVVLGLLCAWLVYRNLLRPTGPSASSSPPAQAAQREQASRRKGDQDLSSLDPTLRLDLLEGSRSVEYTGGSRNIFEIAAPPPAPPRIAPRIEPQPPVVPVEPPPPAIPLRFYGTAQEGSAPRKAFFTNGDEILIGREGDVLAGSYRIIRIGVASAEVEDIRTQRRQQLPLLESN
jgi:hypothetical protein